MHDKLEVLPVDNETRLVDKRELIISIHEQLESQVQFGDSKTTVLIGGDTLLLGIVGALAQFGLRCDEREFRLDCVALTVESVLLFTCAATFIGALTLALFAAKPSAIHSKPPKNLILFSYIGSLSKEEYAKELTRIPEERLLHDMAESIRGKSWLATRKFRLIRYSLNVTLIGVGLLAACIVALTLHR